MKFNILHIIIGLNVGGAELMLKRLVTSNLSGQSFRHRVVSLTDIGSVGTELKELGVEVTALEMRSAFDIPQVLWRLIRLIRESDPQIVQTWMYHADLLGGLAAFFAGKRNVIWGIRTTDVQAGGTRSTMLVRHVCAWLSRFIPHTIVCAAEASRVAHVAAGYCAAKMKVVPNGFDLPKLTASPDQRALLRSHCGFADSTLVVGTLGRFNPAKDHHCFVQAAGIVAKIYPHVCFLMVGRGLDSSNEELKTWISQTGYAERFMLLGERADVPVCLAAMDLFCLSSRTEGFPNVVGEAMAMERSCIVTNVGDAAMLVADTGLVVPREDPLALALGLGEFIAAPSSVRFDLGRRAKGRIYAEFSIDRARDRFESIYNSILRNKEGRD